MTRRSSSIRAESLGAALLATLLAIGCGGGPAEGAEAESDAAAPPPTTVTLRSVAVESPTDELIQAVDPASDDVVWASGHGGTFLRSIDGGTTWSADVVEGHESREFRDVEAFDASRAVLMAAGPGDASRILITSDGGGSWTETFVMDHPEGFLDCMAFWDDRIGIVYGDAVEGELYILRTTDGGESWTRIDPAALPPALEGEGGFAASGTCARAGDGGTGWIATGNGADPRLLVTRDRGEIWEAAPLPLAAGESRGATTIDIRTDGMGFAMGGTIGPGEQGTRVALTADGGLSWVPVDGYPLEGAIYGAAWLPGIPGIAAVGPGGVAFSNDAGMTWTVVDSTRHWAVEFGARTEAGQVGYATGPGGRITRLVPMRVGVSPESSDALFTPRSGDLVVLGGALFDGTGDASRPNPGILIRNREILAMGGEIAPLPDDPAAAGVEVLEVAAGMTILPGFFDLHAHYAVDLFGEGRVDETVVNPVIFLANGVTSTFPAGEVDPPAFDEAVAAIVSGERPGPRIHRSGAYFGSARPGWRGDAMTPDSIRAEVDHWAARGVAGFKAKGIRPEQLEALIERAHYHGLPVTGHLDSGARGSVNPRTAIEMGIDRVEHFLGGDALPDTASAYATLEDLTLDDPETRAELLEQVRRFIASETFFDATLTAYEYYGHQELPVFEDFADERSFLTPYAREVTGERLPRDPVEQFAKIYRVKHETLRFYVENGGGDFLTTGTDHPSWGQFLPGFSIHREMHAMVRAGVPNAVVLRAATINGARALRVSDALGTVEVGKAADLVIVEGDPLVDITTTRNVNRVVRAGEVFDPVVLLESVRGRLGPASEEEADWWRGNVRLGR